MTIATRMKISAIDFSFNYVFFYYLLFFKHSKQIETPNRAKKKLNTTASYYGNTSHSLVLRVATHSLQAKNKEM